MVWSSYITLYDTHMESCFPYTEVYDIINDIIMVSLSIFALFFSLLTSREGL